MHIEENKRRLVSSNLVKMTDRTFRKFNTDGIVNKYLELYNKNPLQIKYLSYLNQVVHELIYIFALKSSNIDPRVKLVKDDLVHNTKQLFL